MKKNVLIAALYEISLSIRPKDPKELVEDFGKMVVKKFNFAGFVAEIPALGISIRFPKKLQTRGEKLIVESEFLKIKFVRREKIPKIYLSILAPLFEKLSETLDSVISGELVQRVSESTDILVIVDRRGVVVRMNDGAEKVLGNLRGKKIEGKWFNRICKHGGRYYSTRIYDLRELGKLIAARDVTEVITLQERLKASEEKFRKIAELSPIAVAVYQNESIVFGNKALEELLGAKLEKLKKNVVWEFIHPDYLKKMRQITKMRLAGKLVPPYEAKIIRTDGEERWVYVYGGLIEWEGEPAVLLEVSDITEMINVRQQLKKMKDTLLLLNKTLRHDVENKLASALTLLEIYENSRDPKFIERAKKAIERATEIIENARKFESAVESQKEKKLVNVRKISKEVASKYQLPIRIKGDGIVSADEGLRSVIENLITNALVHSGTEKVDIQIKQKNGVCEIQVIDYGKGIPKKIRHKIFDEGFRHGEKGGSGMGLSLAKNIVERHGGEITYEENKPKGSIFVIRLKTGKKSAGGGA